MFNHAEILHFIVFQILQHMGKLETFGAPKMWCVWVGETFFLKCCGFIIRMLQLFHQMKPTNVSVQMHIHTTTLPNLFREQTQRRESRKGFLWVFFFLCPSSPFVLNPTKAHYEIKPWLWLKKNVTKLALYE